MDTLPQNPEDNKKKKGISLNDSQKLIVLREWDSRPDNPPSVMELIDKIWGDTIEAKYKDARSFYGKAVKEFLISKDLKQPTIQPFSLKDEDKEYIINNCATMKPFEMAKEITRNPKLSPASLEMKAVQEFIKNEIPKTVLYKNDVKEVSGKYNPPKKIVETVARINKYVNVNLEESKLTPSQKKLVIALQNYLHNVRFNQQINIYFNEEERELFESTFIEHTWNKPDLISEDVDLYIIYSTEKNIAHSIQKQISLLERERDVALEQTNKIPMTIVDSIKVCRDEYNQCIKRQQTLLKGLTEERSKRLNERIGPQFTLLAIVEEMKKEEYRRQLIEDAEKRNEKIKDEYKKWSNMDERIVRIWGHDEDMLING